MKMVTGAVNLPIGLFFMLFNIYVCFKDIYKYLYASHDGQDSQ